MEERFWAKVHIRGPNECWEWQASRSAAGYGHFRLASQTCPAHRVAYELTNGPVPAGMFVLHSCDNPPCVNPAHLRAGTPRDNSLDMVARGRSWQQKRKYCPYGHEYTEENTHIDKRGYRHCLACNRRRCRDYHVRCRRAARRARNTHTDGVR